jgi:hypothetical protein
MSALCQKRIHAVQQSAAEWACPRGLTCQLDDDRQSVNARFEFSGEIGEIGQDHTRTALPKANAVI